LLPADVTCRLMALEELLPGSGLTTVIANVPTVAAVPVACSRVEVEKVVSSGAPASITCAAFTKLPPVTAIEKAPCCTDIGEIVVSTGVGFQSVTALCPAAPESALLTACTVTVFGFGNVAGAV